MKLRSLIGLTAMAAIVMGLAACEWSTTSEKDTTFTRYDEWNFSGSYSGDNGKLWIVHQDGRNLKIYDTAGNVYTGRITKQAQTPWNSGTDIVDTGTTRDNPASSITLITSNFEASGPSGTLAGVLQATPGCDTCVRTTMSFTFISGKHAAGDFTVFRVTTGEESGGDEE